MLQFERIAILLVEGDEDERHQIEEQLDREFPGARFTEVCTQEQFEEAQAAGPFDLAITDYRLPWGDGLAVLHRLKELDPHLPVIMFTGGGSEEIAVQAMKDGLDDYVLKTPEHRVRLGGAAVNAVQKGRDARGLHAAEARFHALFDRVPIGLYQTTPQGRILEANRAFVTMLGYEEEAEALAADARLHYADPRARDRFLDLLRRDGVVRAYEFELKRRDGTTRWMENNARAHRDDQGRLVRLEGSLQDISERKAAEDKLVQAVNALKESEERFRRLAENAKDVIYRYRYHPTSGYEYLSPSVQELSGYTPEEHYRDPDFALEIVHPDDRGLLEEMRREPAHTGRRSWTIRWVHRDGHVLWTEERNTPVFDETGRLIAVEGVVRDVTEQHQAVEANRRMLQALEQSGEGVVITDPDQRIEYANGAVEEMSGFTMGELVGRTPEVFAAEPGFGGRMEDIARAVGNGAVWRGELAGRRKDGAPSQVEASVAPKTGDDGEMTGYVVSLRDITRERRLEEQLRHSQKLEAVGQLAGGVAHDFNNLLTAILGYADVLLGSFVEADERLEDVREIKRSAERAAALTRQLLAFSRRQVLHMSAVDLNAVIRGMERMLARVIGETMVLETRLDPSLGTVRADAGQLEQVLVNLVVNARDAMPEGGRVLVETLRGSRTELAAAEGVVGTPEFPGGDAGRGDSPGGASGEVEYALLRVSDNGIGMAEEVREHAFDPFYTTKETGRGTGLGLSTVYGIVKQVQGEIMLDTRPEHGTVITVALPLETAGRIPATSLESAGAQKPGGGGETVLLVDDEDVIRRLAGRLLRDDGYVVLEAGAGEEALGVAAEHDVDLLVADLVMPGLDGGDVARRLLEGRPGLKILFMSGYRSDDSLEEGFGRDQVSFIQKPFEPGRFRESVRGLLDR